MIIHAVHDADVPAVLAAVHVREVTADYSLGLAPVSLSSGYVHSSSELAAGAACGAPSFLIRRLPGASATR
ncbi:hypothetical protein AAFN69_24120 [Streptomyces sp. CAU 1734]